MLVAVLLAEALCVLAAVRKRRPALLDRLSATAVAVAVWGLAAVLVAVRKKRPALLYRHYAMLNEGGVLAVLVAVSVWKRASLAFAPLLDRLPATAVAVVVAKAVRKRADLAFAPLLDRLFATAVAVLVASLAFASLPDRLQRASPAAACEVAAQEDE